MIMWLNTQYGSYSTIVYLVKMESVTEITIFSLKIMVKRGLEFFYEVPPCKVIFVTEFVILGKNLLFYEGI